MVACHRLKYMNTFSAVSYGPEITACCDRLISQIANSECSCDLVGDHYSDTVKQFSINKTK